MATLNAILGEPIPIAEIFIILHFGRQAAESFARDSKYLEIVEAHGAHEEIEVMTARKSEQLAALEEMVRNLETGLEEAEEEVVKALKAMHVGMRFSRVLIKEVQRLERMEERLSREVENLNIH